MDAKIIEMRIKAQLPSAKITAQDLTGTGDHWRVTVVADEFRNLSLIEQHKKVYAALGELMHRDIHALSLDTKAPK